MNMKCDVRNCNNDATIYEQINNNYDIALCIDHYLKSIEINYIR